MPGKRKAEDEKSTNPNTLRVEKRRKGMTEDELRIDNAKRADAGAIQYRLKQLKKKPEWLSATPEEQKSQIQNCKDEVIHKRKIDGVHHSIIEQHMGIGDTGGAYAKWDDGNTAWVTDDEEEDEITQEALWRADENENGENVTEVISGNFLEERKEYVAQAGLNIKALGFNLWKKNWKRAYRSVKRLANKINKDPDFLLKLPPAIDPNTGVYYPHTPPHLFFTETEMAAWRNYAAWNTEDDFITLLGPAEWWPGNYDSVQHGFFIPEDPAGAERAWQMLQEDSEPADYHWVLPGNKALTVLPQNKESADYLEKFYSM